MPAPGDKAPDFKLPTNDDAGTIALSDYKGKWVVLYWYPADMTSGCTIEARAFQRDAAEYKKRNAVVLGASLDSVDSHREFCEIQGLRFPLLADEDGSVADLYGSLRQFGSVKFSDRHTFLIGPDGVVRKNWKSVNPNVHSKEVLDAIDALST
ncbi:unnamed protein product [Pedinophyceae sp. YPF-701]|nr:unnamed protein product [Pedinophyceae sp. YPF-701]